MNTIDINNILEHINFDGSKLSSFETTLVAAASGANSIPLLKEVGVDFSKLAGSEIAFIVANTGKESIPLLKDAGFNFNYLYATNLHYAIAQGGANLIPTLHENGVRFINFEPWAPQTIMFAGKESIPLLKEVGVDFSKMKMGDIMDDMIGKVTPEMICMLVDAGSDFSELEGYHANENGVTIEFKGDVVQCSGHPSLMEDF